MCISCTTYNLSTLNVSNIRNEPQIGKSSVHENPSLKRRVSARQAVRLTTLQDAQQATQSATMTEQLQPAKEVDPPPSPRPAATFTRSKIPRTDEPTVSPTFVHVCLNLDSSGLQHGESWIWRRAEV